jgi:tRNA-splicing ligase RtcB
MPDAHVGYGLPIGGVLATDGAVIPYAVGVDIACRMRLSVYPVSPIVLGQSPRRFQQTLLDRTYFGAGVNNPERPEHEVLDDPAWRDMPLLRGLQHAAARQIGTSGTGNHFVEWGALQVLEYDDRLGLHPGDYLALLSHSGSRGVGFKIANTYSRLAMETHPKLDDSVRHLAWLTLDSEAGQEYWHAMELAGRFASANHAVIHHAVAEAAGLDEVTAVENHHNFAWKETITDAAGNTREVVVHRKGATPAGRGVLGVIPGSMGDPGYVVRGRGEARALASASHGAGRAMGRRQALQRISREERDRYLAERGVKLLGGGIDESPQAYKQIETVLAAQTELVDVIARFTPRIVRMASEPGDI